jgi:catechol 2,3-dioxygenase-like lactoylglutathione lyase family enzyme
MLTRLDHLVIAVRDLKEAVEEYTARGFSVVSGGRHAVGTHNALISFEDGSYLELIAFYEPRPDHRWWEPLQSGGGLIDFCFETDDLVGDTRKLREAGVRIGDPEEKNRIRPDGYEVRWMYSLALDGDRGVAPFIIEDLTPRGERVPRPGPHGNGLSAVSRVVIALSTQARRAAEGWYGAVLGVGGVEIFDEELEAAGVRFAIGPQRLDLLVPSVPHSPIATRLRHRGPSPYSATLVGEGHEQVLYC